MVSSAVMWRLPVLLARDPEDSLMVLRFLATQLRSSHSGSKRYDRKMGPEDDAAAPPPIGYAAHPHSNLFERAQPLTD
jgi:hypothetical protein